MSNIAVIDADLIGRKRHRFPNLTCMKISSFYKAKGDNVELKTDYQDIEKYEKVFIAKVFTDTTIPDNVLNLPNVEYGGTGFFYDKAKPLPKEIEHSKPDYALYTDFVNQMLEIGEKKKDLKYYTDFSIGFVTRGCFRKCPFCVNQLSNGSFPASPLEEFYDESKKYICLLDDNFLACTEWKQILNTLQATNKPFQFKQGLDERILTEEKINMLFSSKLYGDLIFAFDNYNDKEIIESKLKLIRKLYPDYSKTIKFYVLCGFDRNNQYDNEFFLDDIESVFKRIEMLMRYKCIPYIMRFERYSESKYRGMYVTLARWCNQPNFFKKLSFREFCIKDTGKSPKRYLSEYESVVTNPLLDIKYERRVVNN